MDTLYTKKKVPYIEKNNGTLYLKRDKNYAKAIEHYNKALFSIKLILEDREINCGEKYVVKVIEECEVPISSNLTLWYLKEGDYRNVVSYADKLLQMNPDNVKILYRRGLALAHLNEFEKSKEDLSKVRKLEPNNKEVNHAIKTLKQKRLEYKYKTQKICEKVFHKDNVGDWPEGKKEEVKDLFEEENKMEINLQEGTVSYYINKALEITFAVPLIIYKGCLEKPAMKLVKFGSKVVELPDKLPIIGNWWKKSRKGIAKFVKGKLSHYLDQNNEQPTRIEDLKEEELKEETNEKEKVD